MIQDIQSLTDAYHAWLRDKSTLRQIDDWVEITTPYLDRHNDYVQIYAQRSNGGFTLTDDGYTIGDLEQSGCKLDSRKRQDLLKMTLNGFVITDRNDLDDQLFDTFAAGRALLRQDPVQAQSRDHLRQLLDRAAGGVVFTTIQKFAEAQGVLSERANIVVLADEAHRSQYGFVEGGARWMRAALPNATFVGFTGTPLERDDKNTIHVFGDYADVYDIRQAVEDGATRPLYYESRIVKLRVDEDGARVAEDEVAYVVNADDGDDPQTPGGRRRSPGQPRPAARHRRRDAAGDRRGGGCGRRDRSVRGGRAGRGAVGHPERCVSYARDRPGTEEPGPGNTAQAVERSNPQH